VKRTLYLSARSPFSRKVRILLLEKGLSFTPETVDFSARSPEFVAISPYGKIPVLADEDGTVVFDSTVIAEYLEDRYPDPPMLGRTWSERLLHRSLDELGDTIGDQAVALWQSRARGDAAGEERAHVLARKALTELERRSREGRWPADFGLGDAAVISGLGYFALRHGRALLEDHPELLRRVALHDARASVASTVPHA
jgi:glutathione S-transferase